MAIGENNKYLILISERQRKILVDVLDGGAPERGEEEERDLLLTMLTDDAGLDEDRADREDVVNDFTA